MEAMDKLVQNRMSGKTEDGATYTSDGVRTYRISAKVDSAGNVTELYGDYHINAKALREVIANEQWDVLGSVLSLRDDDELAFGGDAILGSKKAGFLRSELNTYVDQAHDRIKLGNAMGNLSLTGITSSLTGALRAVSRGVSDNVMPAVQYTKQAVSRTFSGGKPVVSNNAYSPEIVNERSAGFYKYYDDSNPLRGTLSNHDARQWYLNKEQSIPELLNRANPLAEQAKQAFELRNQFRTETRVMMQDRVTADRLFREEINLTFEQLTNKTKIKLINKGISNPSNDQIYQEMINSSQRSRQSVNKQLGL